MSMEIRAFQTNDLDALYSICRMTGWRGTDATGLYPDPSLLGDFYAAPYVEHDRDLCLIATLNGSPAGYILGTADSIALRSWAEVKWLPALRERHPLPHPSDDSPNATLVRTVHAGYQLPSFIDRYPAHLHIDLLPCLQGRGVGAELMSRFFDLLRDRHCPAVHLVVNKANTRAVAFYRKAGCHIIEDWPNHAAFGFALT